MYNYANFSEAVRSVQNLFEYFNSKISLDEKCAKILNCLVLFVANYCFLIFDFKIDCYIGERLALAELECEELLDSTNVDVEMEETA